MHLGSEHGLSAADLTRFDELTKSNSLKGAIPIAPSCPHINEAASAGAHEMATHRWGARPTRAMRWCPARNC